MMELPIFHRSKKTENKSAWIIEFWNGWLFVIPKDQRIIDSLKRNGVKEIYVKDSYASRLVSEESMCVETTDISIFTVRVNQSIKTFESSVWDWCLDLSGFLCGSKNLDAIMRLIEDVQP